MNLSHLLEDRLLFPLEGATFDPASFGVTREMNVDLQTFNSLISSNRKQLEAVNAILERPPGSTPFVIFGPLVFYTLSYAEDDTNFFQTWYREDGYMCRSNPPAPAAEPFSPHSGMCPE
jgi:hypothetical protein